MSAPEFSRMVDARQAGGRDLTLTASEGECAALAERFGLVAIRRLAAEVALTADGPVILADGRLKAAIVQTCAVSGEDLPVRIDEPLALRFAPAGETADEELELDADDCDEIAFTGHHFDLGEAVAQSLALAIDPFATGPNAEEARRKAGLLDPEDAGPFAALKALKKD